MATLPPQLGGDGSTVYPGANHITAIRTRIGKLARYVTMTAGLLWLFPGALK